MSQRLRNALGILIALAFASGTAQAQSASAPDTIAARVQGCATCHGSSGEGSGDENFPRIAGKPAGYVFN